MKKRFVVILTACFLVLSPVLTYSVNGSETFKFSMLKINEVYAAPYAGFIEIYNTSSFGIKFPAGWSIHNGPIESSLMVTIPENTILYSGNYLTVVPDPSAGIPDGSGDNTIFPQPEEGFNWNDTDEIRLYYKTDTSITLVDVFSWGNSANSWGLFPDGSNELHDDLIPTPGVSNKLKELLPTVPTVRLNEIQTKSSPELNYDFIELFNYGDEDFSLENFSLSDENMSPVSPFPKDALIPAGGYFVFIPDTFISGLIESEYAIVSALDDDLTFGLGKSDTVYLLYKGAVVDSFSWDDGHHQSIGIMENPTQQWITNLEPTPGAENKTR